MSNGLSDRTCVRCGKIIRQEDENPLNSDICLECQQLDDESLESDDAHQEREDDEE